MDYKNISESIMESQSGIRLVTICDLDGNILHSGHRQGVTNLLSQDESKRSLELAVNSWKKRTELAPKIGRGKYVLAEYEKIKRITMPLGDKYLLYVTTETSTDHTKLLDRIYKLSLQ